MLFDLNSSPLTYIQVDVQHRAFRPSERGLFMTDKPKSVEVEMVESSYQPSKAELEEDLRVDADFDETVEALAQDETIRNIPCPKKD